MTERLKIIFSEISPCKTFADIGCDHGYIAKAVLENGKAEKVIVSDISEKCLDKAKDLLKEEIAESKAEAVVSDGFDKVTGADEALIAGMGGEEIVSILLNAKSLPERLILQPMKNAEKVRKTAVELGFKTEKDYVFKSGGKFYDLIVLSKGKDFLTEEEIEFGRTNLKEFPSAFIERIKHNILTLEKVLRKGDLSLKAQAETRNKIERLNKYVKN